MDFAMLMFKSSAGECCPAMSPWKLMSSFFLQSKEDFMVMFLPFFWVWGSDRAGVLLEVCHLVHQLAFFAMDIWFPLIIL